MSTHIYLKDPPSDWTNIYTKSHKVYQHQGWHGLTTAERDAFTPEQGMIIFNTTETRFQGYWNGQWRNFGAEADAATIPVIVAKTGSGSGNYTTVNTDGSTGASIDSANLDYTVTIPTGYKLTVDANIPLTSTSQINKTHVFFYDGGTDGSGGSEISRSFINGSNGGGGGGQAIGLSLHGVVDGDDAEHNIQLMAFTAGSTTSIFNTTVDNRLTVPKSYYRLEKAS